MRARSSRRRAQPVETNLRPMSTPLGETTLATIPVPLDTSQRTLTPAMSVSSAANDMGRTQAPPLNVWPSSGTSMPCSL